MWPDSGHTKVAYPKGDSAGTAAASYQCVVAGASEKVGREWRDTGKQHSGNKCPGEHEVEVRRVLFTSGRGIWQGYLHSHVCSEAQANQESRIWSVSHNCNRPSAYLTVGSRIQLW